MGTNRRGLWVFRAASQVTPEDVKLLLPGVGQQSWIRIQLDEIYAYRYQAFYDHTHGHCQIPDATFMGTPWNQKSKTCSFGKGASQEERDNALETCLAWLWGKHEYAGLGSRRTP